MLIIRNYMNCILITLYKLMMYYEEIREYKIR